jgi:hypothetical protein
MYNQTAKVIRQLIKENVKDMEQESAKWRKAPVPASEKLMLKQSRQDSLTMERFNRLLSKFDAEYNRLVDKLGEEYKKFNSETYRIQAKMILAKRNITL